jgi:hypothetical protein
LADVTYYVVLAFARDEQGELVTDAPVQLPSAAMAISRAKTLASTKAGAIAFSRTGDPALGDFADATMLFKAGEVPDDVFARGE